MFQGSNQSPPRAQTAPAQPAAANSAQAPRLDRVDKAMMLEAKQAEVAAESDIPDDVPRFGSGHR